jgi:hypothetical protein
MLEDARGHRWEMTQPVRDVEPEGGGRHHRRTVVIAGRMNRTESEIWGRTGPRVHGKRPEMTQSDREQKRSSERLSRLFPLVAKVWSADS